MSEFNIKELRLRKRLSQEELGKQLGVSKQTISSWETESRSPNKKQRQSILRIFKLKSREQLEAENKELKEKSKKLAEALEEIIQNQDSVSSYIGGQTHSCKIAIKALKEYRGE